MAEKIPLYQLVFNKISKLVDTICFRADINDEQKLQEWIELIEKAELTSEQKTYISESLKSLIAERLWGDHPEVDERIKRTRDFLKILADKIS